MCPWRNPAADVATWFPDATRGDTEVRILSGLRPEMTQRLGRPPTTEENALYVHRMWKASEPVGEVIVRRVKGESGAVELVVGFEPDGRVRGVRFQRSREREEVTAALSEFWLSSFRGKRASDRFIPGEDLPVVADSAQVTARAVADGVRSLTVLRELATGPGAVRRPAPEVAAGHFH
jgi:hypothetical protein